MRKITKVGACIVSRSRILLVRKEGSSVFILPGGKPEPGEDGPETLRRELREELGCEVSDPSVAYLGSFSDVAADAVATTVTVILYSAELLGTPAPLAEIAEIAWLDLDGASALDVAPSLRNSILPFVRTRVAGKVPEAGRRRGRRQAPRAGQPSAGMGGAH